MPLFLPFLLAASAVLAIAAGSKTGWRTSAELAEDERRQKGLPPTVQGAPPSRWFYWYIHNNGQTSSYGAVKMTDAEAFRTEFNTKTQNLGAQLQRYIWAGGNNWVRDTRSDPQFLASAPVPGLKVGADALVVYPYPEITSVSGSRFHTHTLPAVLSSVGAMPITPPIRGRWSAPGFPAEVTMAGRLFRKANWQWPYTGVVAQYREAIPVNSRHLLVLDDGSFIIDHYDEANPDSGAAFEHLVKDVLKRPTGAPARPVAAVSGGGWA